MPIPCQGMTITWGGQQLQEVQSLDINLSRGLPVGRITTWTPSWGTVQIAGFSTASLPEESYGSRRLLQFIAVTAAGAGSPVTLFSRDCIYEGARSQALANDAARFAFTFTIQDTAGAPSIS